MITGRTSTHVLLPHTINMAYRSLHATLGIHSHPLEADYLDGLVDSVQRGR
ncbi:hypothetical protein BH10ACI4_BH10ACI4_17010 [soil metagenome]